MRKINEIIIHCSDTEQNENFKAADIDSWHRHRGFDCIGYHYVIDIDGKIELGRKFGRPDSKVGAHCKNHNAHSIGVCYIGGKRYGKHFNTITAAQIDSLYDFLLKLCVLYELSYDSIKLHYEYNKNKVCPCFTRSWFDEIFKERIIKTLDSFKLSF